MLNPDTRKNVHISQVNYEYIRRVAFENRMTITSLIALVINELPNILRKKGLKDWQA